jgi:small subunit ribosomal protein S20
VANTAQAKKRARQAEAHRARNVTQRSALRTAIKKVLKAVETKDKAAAQSAYREACATIDRSAGKGLIHKNNAARHKSHLNARVRALG